MAGCRNEHGHAPDPPDMPGRPSRMNAAAIDKGLLLQAIAPRPLIWATTLCATSGRPVMAGFSAITIISTDPPVILLVVQPTSDGARKRTATNILARRDFVINAPSIGQLDALMRSADPAVAGDDRVAVSGVALVQATAIDGVRFAAANYALECRLQHHQQMPPGVDLFFGEVLAVHDGQPQARDGPRFLGTMGYEWFTSEEGLHLVDQPYLNV